MYTGLNPALSVYSHQICFPLSCLLSISSWECIHWFSGIRRLDMIIHQHLRWFAAVLFSIFIIYQPELVFLVALAWLNSEIPWAPLADVTTRTCLPRVKVPPPPGTIHKSSLAGASHWGGLGGEVNLWVARFAFFRMFYILREVVNTCGLFWFEQNNASFGHSTGFCFSRTIIANKTHASLFDSQQLDGCFQK